MTVAVNCWVMPAVKLAGAGVITMEIPDFGMTMTVEVAAAVASAALVAAMVTLAGLGMAEGAVYMPVALTFPRVVLPPGMPFTDQVRAVFVVPVTVAENCCVACTLTLAVGGILLALFAGSRFVSSVALSHNPGPGIVASASVAPAFVIPARRR